MKRWGVVLIGALLIGIVAGCASSSGEEAATTLDVITESMAFTSKEITLEKGKLVKLVLNNKDAVLHDFSIDKIGVKVKEAEGAEHNEQSKAPDLHVAADAGKTGTVEFTLTAPGTYTYYCTVPGHKDAGMSGTLTVR